MWISKLKIAFPLSIRQYVVILTSQKQSKETENHDTGPYWLALCALLPLIFLFVGCLGGAGIRSHWNCSPKRAKIQHCAPPFWIVLSSLAACPWRQIVQREQRSGNVGSFFRTHVIRPLVSLYNLTSRTSGQAAKYDSKWRRTVLNFGILWRGISVGSDAL